MKTFILAATLEIIIICITFILPSGEITCECRPDTGVPATQRPPIQREIPQLAE